MFDGHLGAYEPGRPQGDPGQSARGARHHPPEDSNAPPPARVPSSRTLARLRDKTEAAARAAAAAEALAKQVQSGLRTPPGRLFAVDANGLVLRGPAGGIGTSERVVRTLEPFSAGGRHSAATLLTAGGWASEAALCEALASLGPKLAAVGLRICRRKVGQRIARVR